MSQQVAILFARQDSIYKTLPDCDVWDIERDARKWPGGCPAVTHPPCRAWGQLSHMAKPRPDEKELAPWAIEQVRKWGGVLEHPARSRLWPHCGLPKPGQRDTWGGWTLAAPQQWWGHRAEKNTRFYIVGCEPWNVPEIPFVIGRAPCRIGDIGKKGDRPQKGDPRYHPEIPKNERERTPPALALWLVELARRCKPCADAEGKKRA